MQDETGFETLEERLYLYLEAERKLKQPYSPKVVQRFLEQGINTSSPISTEIPYSLMNYAVTQAKLGLLNQFFAKGATLGEREELLLKLIMKNVPDELKVRDPIKAFTR